jgi:hypothetical protein
MGTRLHTHGGVAPTAPDALHAATTGFSSARRETPWARTTRPLMAAPSSTSAIGARAAVAAAVPLTARARSFALMEQYGIEFNEAAQQHTQNRKHLRRLMRVRPQRHRSQPAVADMAAAQGNIALVVVLEDLMVPRRAHAHPSRRPRKRRLCFTNTHIYWDPGARPQDRPRARSWLTAHCRVRGRQAVADMGAVSGELSTSFAAARVR